MQLPQLTFTRFIAAISIVILHFGIDNWPFNTPTLFPVIVRSLSAVSYFFLLSGFILVISMSRNAEMPTFVPKKKFWINRLARIYPVYLFSLLFFFLLNFHHDPTIALIWQLKGYVLSFFMLHTWDYQMAMDINFPSWTLGAEALFYLLFPWIYQWVSRVKSPLLIIFAILAWAINSFGLKWCLDHHVPHNFAFYSPIMHVATFLIGIITGILLVRHWKWLKAQTFYLGLGTIFLLAFLLVAVYLHFSFFEVEHNGLLAPFFVCVILYLSVAENVLTTLFTSKPAQFLGNISYSVYLLQLPVIQLCKAHLPFLQGKSNAAVFWYYLILLILFSSATYYFIERPLRTWIKQRWSN